MRSYLVRILACCLVLFGAGTVALGSVGSAASVTTAASQSVAPAAKVEAQVLADTANGKIGAFVVLLADQADVSAAYNIKDKNSRGWYVYNRLKNKADQTQDPLKATLDAVGVKYQSFWVANAIVVYNGSRAIVDQLAARSDVKLIESNDSYRGIEDPQIADLTPADNQPNAPTTIEPGITDINAPAVWSMGYTGQNIVIGNADTGMQWDHPALKPHYRGWNGTTADHNYNWHDAIHDSSGNPCGNNSMFPCDDNGHGTHTTGTTSGDDGAGNQIGVAPGAKWIGCHNMDRGNGTPARYTECFQWFIAPTDLNGNNPNPALRPDVINNSWTCPASEGCAAGTLETIVNNTQAAGVFVEASAGNAGPGCSTVSDPPAIYSASFSTGAYQSSNHVLAGFSSRGPSTYYSPPLLKPEISAPGVGVRSSYPTNSYASLSGTSMAGPHVVGSVALLWSARPQLERDITTTKQILENTANPNVVVSPVQTCGGTPSNQIPNNSFGYGRVDVLAAVNSVPLATPTPGGATATPVAGTPTATPTQCGASAAWVNKMNLPAVRTRALGAYYPGNGKFYLLGGRTSDSAGSDVLNPTEYNPATDTWTQKAATFPTNFVNNMAGGVITISGTQQIIAVSGNFATGTTTTGSVYLYNPNTDAITTLSSDPWTPGVMSSTVPGGFTVLNNKLYVIGGIILNVGNSSQIWEFDPTRAAGSRWLLKNAILPVPLSYVPVAAIGNVIYTAGGTTYDGTTLTDSTNSYAYNPGTDTIFPLTNQIPRATGETRALNYNGKLWVLGGGRVSPNPSNEVDIYDPVAGTWSVGLPFNNARRNDGADSDGTHIFLAAGYATTTPTNSLEVYNPATSCNTPTATTVPATNTPVPATATSTAVPATATSTAVPATSTPAPTNTPGGHTNTPVPTNTPAPTNTPGGPTNTPVVPTVTPTDCPNPFVD
ncbi:MAG: hypothetical protein DLM69_00455, partial [Candidatus Chloroheliales bacterium]